jgi:hypothetical protein
LGERRGRLAAYRYIRRRGDELSLRLFHKLMFYQLFGESFVFSDRHNGIIEYLQFYVHLWFVKD